MIRGSSRNIKLLRTIKDTLKRWARRKGLTCRTNHRNWGLSLRPKSAPRLFRSADVQTATAGWRGQFERLKRRQDRSTCDPSFLSAYGRSGLLLSLILLWWEPT